MSTLFIPVGIPGCGKSTYWKTNLRLNQSFHAVAYTSADAIRQKLRPGVVYDPELNGKVFALQREHIAEQLSYGRAIYVDNTNVQAFARAELYEIAQKQGSQVNVILFKNIAQAVERNKARTGEVSGTMRIPDEAMDKMIANLSNTFDIIDSEPWDSLTVIESFGLKSVS